MLRGFCPRVCISFVGVQPSAYLNPTKEIYWHGGPMYIFYVVCTLQNGPHSIFFFISFTSLQNQNQKNCTLFDQ